MENGSNTNGMFVGGAGMFIEYHDVIRPVKLMAIYSLIIHGTNLGIPIDVLTGMNSISLVEWYINRSCTNPLKVLDIDDRYTDDELDNVLLKVMNSDESLYDLAPLTNAFALITSYKRNKMNFPIYVYTPEYEVNAELDIQKIFDVNGAQYVYGDLRKVVQKLDNNFTYIVSDIELCNRLCDLLRGNYAHMLLMNDYRYNYTDYFKTHKYDLSELMQNTPIVRIGMVSLLNRAVLVDGIIKLLSGGSK